VYRIPCGFFESLNEFEADTIVSVAAAFTKVVSSFVSDIILPVISLLPFLNRNLEEKFAVLRPGPKYEVKGYNTVAQALDDGAVVLAWG
jgi:large conductance mechanosensitive channel